MPVFLPVLAGLGALAMMSNPRRRKRRRRNPNGSEITAHELVLFIVNDGDLYRQQTQPILKNLAKKIKKGVYDHAKAVKLWGYLADNGAQRYTKESSSGYRGATSYGIFSKPIRMIAAKELQDYYQEDLDSTVQSNPRRRRSKRRR